MGSEEQFKGSWKPFWAIMQTDLENLLKNKITYIWLIIAIFIQIIRILMLNPFMRIGGAPLIITNGLSDFIYLWSMIIIGVSASAISSETGELADSIMSKAVTRFNYVLAKFSSRIIYVLITYAVITTALTGVTLRINNSGYETYGLISAILYVALALIMLTTVGVSLSIVIPNKIVSIIVLLVLWHSMNIFLPILDLTFLAPTTIIDQLPDIIQGNSFPVTYIEWIGEGTWIGAEWKTITGFAVISITATILSNIYFSIKDL